MFYYSNRQQLLDGALIRHPVRIAKELPHFLLTLPCSVSRSTTDPISDPHSFHVRWVYRKYLFFSEKGGSLWICCALVCSFSISGIILSVNSMLTGGSTLDPQRFTSWCLRSQLLAHSPGQGANNQRGRRIPWFALWGWLWQQWKATASKIRTEAAPVTMWRNQNSRGCWTTKWHCWCGNQYGSF